MGPNLQMFPFSCLAHAEPLPLIPMILYYVINEMCIGNQVSQRQDISDYFILFNVGFNAPSLILLHLQLHLNQLLLLL